MTEKEIKSDRWLTSKEIALLLRVSSKTIRNWRHSGKISEKHVQSVWTRYGEEKRYDPVIISLLADNKNNRSNKAHFRQGSFSKKFSPEKTLTQKDKAEKDNQLIKKELERSLGSQQELLIFHSAQVKKSLRLNYVLLISIITLFTTVWLGYEHLNHQLTKQFETLQQLKHQAQEKDQIIIEKEKELSRKDRLLDNAINNIHLSIQTPSKQYPKRLYST